MKKTKTTNELEAINRLLLFECDLTLKQIEICINNVNDQSSVVQKLWEVMVEPYIQFINTVYGDYGNNLGENQVSETVNCLTLEDNHINLNKELIKSISDLRFRLRHNKKSLLEMMMEFPSLQSIAIDLMITKSGNLTSEEKMKYDSEIIESYVPNNLYEFFDNEKDFSNLKRLLINCKLDTTTYADIFDNLFNYAKQRKHERDYERICELLDCIKEHNVDIDNEHFINLMMFDILPSKNKLVINKCVENNFFNNELGYYDDNVFEMDTLSSKFIMNGFQEHAEKYFLAMDNTNLDGVENTFQTAFSYECYDLILKMIDRENIIYWPEFASKFIKMYLDHVNYLNKVGKTNSKLDSFLYELLEILVKKATKCEDETMKIDMLKCICDIEKNCSNTHINNLKESNISNDPGQKNAITNLAFTLNQVFEKAAEEIPAKAKVATLIKK